MADFSKFRTSIGGFNRTDVSDYIETLCMEQQKALRQCREEAEALKERLAKAEQALAAQKTENEALEQALAAQKRENETLQNALTLQEDEYAVEDGAAESAEEPDDAPDYPSLELEAYRRAEATERLAAERAQRVRQQLSDLLDGVAARYEESGQEIHALTEDLRTNLKRLEETLSDLDLLFDETTGAFDGMGAEELLVTEA